MAIPSAVCTVCTLQEFSVLVLPQWSVCVAFFFFFLFSFRVTIHLLFWWAIATPWPYVCDYTQPFIVECDNPVERENPIISVWRFVQLYLQQQEQQHEHQGRQHQYLLSPVYPVFRSLSVLHALFSASQSLHFVSSA